MDTLTVASLISKISRCAMAVPLILSTTLSGTLAAAPNDVLHPPLPRLERCACRRTQSQLRAVEVQVRKAALRALGRADGARVPPCLRAMAHDTKAEVRQAALHALADIGGTPAAEAIRVALVDEDWT